MNPLHSRGFTYLGRRNFGLADGPAQADAASTATPTTAEAVTAANRHEPINLCMHGHLPQPPTRRYGRRPTPVPAPITERAAVAHHYQA